jgi:hypothetical protein
MRSDVFLHVSLDIALLKFDIINLATGIGVINTETQMHTPQSPSSLLRINKGVPLPKTQRYTPTARRKYPFEDMQPGDMFFVPEKKKNTLATHASIVGKRLKRQFVTRLLWMVEVDDEENPGGTRWVTDYEVEGKIYDVDSETEGAVLGIGVWRVK